MGHVLTSEARPSDTGHLRSSELAATTLRSPGLTSPLEGLALSVLGEARVSSGGRSGDDVCGKYVCAYVFFFLRVPSLTFYKGVVTNDGTAHYTDGTARGFCARWRETLCSVSLSCLLPALFPCRGKHTETFSDTVPGETKKNPLAAGKAFPRPAR